MGGGSGGVLVLSLCCAVWNYSAPALMLSFFGFVLHMWAWASAWAWYLFRYRTRGPLSSFLLFDVSPIFLGSQSPLFPRSSWLELTSCKARRIKTKEKKEKRKFCFYPLACGIYVSIYLAGSLARMRKFLSAFLMCVSTVPFVTWATRTQLYLGQSWEVKRKRRNLTGTVILQVLTSVTSLPTSSLLLSGLSSFFSIQPGVFSYSQRNGP